MRHDEGEGGDRGILNSGCPRCTLIFVHDRQTSTSNRNTRYKTAHTAVTLCTVPMYYVASYTTASCTAGALTALLVVVRVELYVINSTNTC